jgi:hypothetical protein
MTSNSAVHSHIERADSRSPHCITALDIRETLFIFFAIFQHLGQATSIPVESLR